MNVVFALILINILTFSDNNTNNALFYSKSQKSIISVVDKKIVSASTIFFTSCDDQEVINVIPVENGKCTFAIQIKGISAQNINKISLFYTNNNNKEVKITDANITKCDKQDDLYACSFAYTKEYKKIIVKYERQSISEKKIVSNWQPKYIGTDIIDSNNEIDMRFQVGTLENKDELEKYSINILDYNKNSIANITDKFNFKVEEHSGLISNSYKFEINDTHKYIQAVFYTKLGLKKVLIIPVRRNIDLFITDNSGNRSNCIYRDKVNNSFNTNLVLESLRPVVDVKVQALGENSEMLSTPPSIAQTIKSFFELNSNDFNKSKDNKLKYPFTIELNKKWKYIKITIISKDINGNNSDNKEYNIEKTFKICKDVENIVSRQLPVFVFLNPAEIKDEVIEKLPFVDTCMIHLNGNIYDFAISITPSCNANAIYQNGYELSQPYNKKIHQIIDTLFSILSKRLHKLDENLSFRSSLVSLKGKVIGMADGYGWIGGATIIKKPDNSEIVPFNFRYYSQNDVIDLNLLPNMNELLNQQYDNSIFNTMLPQTSISDNKTLAAYRAYFVAAMVSKQLVPSNKFGKISKDNLVILAKHHSKADTKGTYRGIVLEFNVQVDY